MQVEVLERSRVGGGSAFAGGAVRNSESNGQIVATGDLTDMQAAFADAYTSNGGIGTEAAKAAGYTGEATSTASQLLKNPKVRARINELVSFRLETKGAVVGYGVLMEIAQDVTAPPGVRAKVAFGLLELAGYYKKGQADSYNPRKSLSEMTREELESVVAHSANVLKAAAKIEERPAPVDAPLVDVPALSTGQD